MMIKTVRRTGMLALVSLLLVSGADRGSADVKRKLCDHIHRVRALEALVASKASSGAGKEGAERQINHVLSEISALPLFVENAILPYSDSARIAKRIDSLLQQLEQTDDNEKVQLIRLNLAYEYFLFYRCFLNEKYLLDFEKAPADVLEYDIHQLVSNRELSLYLLQAQLYLQPLIGFSKQPSGGSDSALDSANRLPEETPGTSYMVRDNPELYMNAGFIAFMVECEKLAGRYLLATKDQTDRVFDAGPPSIKAIRYFDETTWSWLNMLWKRYRQAEAGGGGDGVSRAPESLKGFTSYYPSARHLYALYRTYLSYHFMWRYIADASGDSPFYNTLTRLLFQRLNTLQQDAGYNYSVYYRYYLDESAKDGGQVNFLPSLFFARRGYAVRSAVADEAPPRALFDLYGTLYKRAADKIENNICYRSRIYNELVLFGLRLNHLRLMENELYSYALKSIRIASADTYRGTEFARSPRLTTAYLMARMLEAKKDSGLHQGFKKYRDLAESFSPLLVPKNNSNWRFAAAIHHALAVFYSRRSRGHTNEAMAMYHARQAFLVPCEKVALTYGKANWDAFFDLKYREKAEACLKLFLYFHNKYSTVPEAAIPEKFNAHKIIDRWLQNRQYEEK